jgi:hypothetical protein
MSKWKAFAVFFTLLFFSSLRGSLFVYFSTSDEIKNNRFIWLALAILVNLFLLFLAIRYWQRAFKADKNRPD